MKIEFDLLLAPGGVRDALPVLQVLLHRPRERPLPHDAQHPARLPARAWRPRNLFRTILSWPFASLFAPLGDLAAHPQHRAVEDLVRRRLAASSRDRASSSARSALSRRDLSEIIPLACSEDETVRSTAILDLLYLFGRETRARNSLREIFFGRRNLFERIGDLLQASTAEAPAPRGGVPAALRVVRAREQLPQAGGFRHREVRPGVGAHADRACSRAGSPVPRVAVAPEVGGSTKPGGAGTRTSGVIPDGGTARERSRTGSAPRPVVLAEGPLPA